MGLPQNNPEKQNKPPTLDNTAYPFQTAECVPAPKSSEAFFYTVCGARMDSAEAGGRVLNELNSLKTATTTMDLDTRKNVSA